MVVTIPKEFAVSHVIRQIGIFAKEAKPEPIYSCSCGALIYGDVELKDHSERFPDAHLATDEATESTTDKFEKLDGEKS